MAITLSAGVGLGANPVFRFGTEAQRRRFLPRLVSKELGAFSNEIDGQLAHEGADSISLGVSIARAYRGTTIGTTTQVLFLGRSEVVEVRRRTFSTSRTVLLSAGTLVGFGLAAAGIAQLVDPNGPPDNSTTPPPPPALRRPSGYHLGMRIPFP